MNISPIGYLLADTLARQEGLKQPRVGQLALVGAVLPSPLMSAVVVQQMARNERPTSTASAPTAAASTAPVFTLPGLLLATPSTVPTAPGTAPTIPAGAKYREVPKVDLGADYKAAAAWLRENGFGARQQDVPDRDEKPGTVIGQEPPGGWFRPVGSTVTLYISAGQPPTRAVAVMQAVRAVANAVKAAPDELKATTDALVAAAPAVGRALRAVWDALQDAANNPHQPAPAQAQQVPVAPAQAAQAQAAQAQAAPAQAAPAQAQQVPAPEPPAPEQQALAAQKPPKKA